MLSLLILLASAIIVAIFATQNTALTTITIASYPFTDVPMYIVVLGSLFIGILVSWMFSLLGSISSFYTMHGKDVKISERNKEISALNKRVHQLELENEKVKAQRDTITRKSV